MTASEWVALAVIVALVAYGAWGEHHARHRITPTSEEHEQ